MLRPILDNFLPFSLFVLASFFIYQLISYYRERSRIIALGASPARVSTWFPFGLDIIVRNVQAHRQQSDLEFWDWAFSFCKPHHFLTVEIYTFGLRVILTADPENIKALLATQFQDYGKGVKFHEEWEEFLGDGIFNVDHELWTASRQLLRPQFTKERVSGLAETFHRHVEVLLERIEDARGGVVDVADLFYAYTLDVASDYLFGSSVNSLSGAKSKEELGFIEAFAEVQRHQALLGKVGPFRALLPKKAFRQAIKTLDEFIYPFVDRVLDSKISEPSSQGSFLQALAATGERNRKVFRDQSINVLLAGRDTTAGTLSFLFLELAKHPTILAKLRREIQERLGTSAPSYEDLKDMPFLKNCINEILRLYPTVPFNVGPAI